METEIEQSHFYDNSSHRMSTLQSFYVQDKIPKGVIECGKILQVYSADKPGKADKHKFYAVTDERTFAFKASSESLMKIWMAVLSLKSNSLRIR